MIPVGKRGIHHPNYLHGHNICSNKKLSYGTASFYLIKSLEACICIRFCNKSFLFLPTIYAKNTRFCFTFRGKFLFNEAAPAYTNSDCSILPNSM